MNSFANMNMGNGKEEKCGCSRRRSRKRVCATGTFCIPLAERRISGCRDAAPSANRRPPRSGLFWAPFKHHLIRGRSTCFRSATISSRDLSRAELMLAILEGTVGKKLGAEN